mgnify:CR=1 FL=1
MACRLIVGKRKAVAMVGLVLAATAPDYIVGGRCLGDASSY